MTIDEWLNAVIAALKIRSTPAGEQQLRHLIEAEGPSLLSEVVGDSLSIRGRTQMGTPADVVWVGLFPAKSGTSAQKGYYLVYLFAKDASAVYLSLACGTERIKMGEVRLRAQLLRDAVGPAALETDIDLRSSNFRPRKYQAATAYAYRYDAENIPGQDQLTTDLEHMVGLLSKAQESGLNFDDAPGPAGDERTILKIAPGAQAKFWDDCLSNNYIRVGWDEIGDLSEFESFDELRDKFLDVFSERYSVARVGSHRAKQLWMLRNLKPGDVVIANRGKSHVLAVGTVVEPGYVWRPELDEFRQTVDVQWDTSLSKDIPPQHDWRNTIVPVSQALYESIISGGKAGAPDELFADIESALERRQQVILYGPPGTGKTHIARHFAVWWLAKNMPELSQAATLAIRDAENDIAAKKSTHGGQSASCLTRITFHPSYSYEDFVEGYRPRPTEAEGLTLDLKDGSFKTVCRVAEAHMDKRFLVLVDEINRGNIPKIFGELITLLERDKRGVTVVLPQSGEDFSVPANVFVIGTMNTADRSIRLLDAALRRRFAFIELLPRPDLLNSEVGPLRLDVFLEELNSRITAEVGREKLIGHSFFLDAGEPLDTPEDFAWVFRQEILPLLQEYSYDDYTRLKTFLGPDIVDDEHQVILNEVLSDPHALVQALAQEYTSPSVPLDEEEDN